MERGDVRLLVLLCVLGRAAAGAKKQKKKVESGRTKKRCGVALHLFFVGAKGSKGSRLLLVCGLCA